MDKNPYNCKKDNLYCQNGKVKMISRSVVITHDDKFIYIKARKTGVHFVTNYERDLLMLIASPRISWTLRNDKERTGKDYNILSARITYRNKVCMNCFSSLPEIVYGYYHFNLRANNITTTIRKMKKELRSGKLVVEHLIADELNNTEANLSLVNEITNSKKKVIDGKIQPPYYLIMAYKSGGYKAVFCYGDSEMMYVYPVITASNMETLLDTLKGLLSKEVLGEYKSAFQWHKDSMIKKYYLPKSYEVQRYLYDNFDNELSDVRVAEYIQATVEGKER